MSDVDFLLLAFENAGLLTMLMITGCGILYVATRRRELGVTDPFHFYYTFTFGTSYAIVVLLGIAGSLSGRAIALVAGFGLLLLVGLKVGELFPAHPRGNREADRSAEEFILRSCIRRGLILSVALVLIQAVITGLPFGVESRFEANRGLGFIARLLDPLRIVLAGMLWIAVRKKSWLYKVCAGAYIVVLALFSGAKFAFLECAYAAWMTGRLTEDASRKPDAFSSMSGTIRRAALYVLVVALAVVFALILLEYSPMVVEAKEVERVSYVDGVPVALEFLLLRILANGDMYYMGLPSDVFFENVVIRNSVAQILGAIVGDSVMQRLFSYSLADTEVGRQIWLYWYPGDTVMRGPTNHFDLAAYAYFGPIGGAIFCLILGVTLGRFRRGLLFSGHFPAWRSAMLTLIYLRLLLALLSPSVSMAYLIDAIIVGRLLVWRKKLRSVDIHSQSNI